MTQKSMSKKLKKLQFDFQHASKSLHQENWGEEDHLFWRFPSATGFTIAIEKWSVVMQAQINGKK